MANFIDAGNSAVQKAVAARKALAESKADLSKINKTAIQQDAYNVEATADRNAKSAIAKNDIETAKKGAEMKSAYEKVISVLGLDLLLIIHKLNRMN